MAWIKRCKRCGGDATWINMMHAWFCRNCGYLKPHEVEEK